MILKSIISVVLVSNCLVQCLAQNTPKTESNVVTTLLTTEVPSTVKTEIKIECLDGNCNNNTPKDDNQKSKPRKGVEQKSSKKELDNPKIIDLHKSDDGDHVKGRKGMNPGVDVVTEANVHVEDLNSLKKNSTTVTLAPSTTTTTKSTTKKTVATTKTSISSTSATTKKIKTTKPEKEVQTKESIKDSTSKTSLFVGIVLAGVLLSVLGFVGFKRLDAIRRRREYRRMNDFLIDGMYNEL